MARSNRYDDLLPFLGDNKDDRGRLALDAMKDNWRQSENQNFRDISITNDDDDEKILNPISILSFCKIGEIQQWAYDIEQKNEYLPENVIKAGLNTIRNYKDNGTRFSHFKYLVIIKFATIKKGDFDITQYPKQWNEATSWTWNKRAVLDSIIEGENNKEFEGNKYFKCNINKYLLQKLYENVGKVSEEKMTKTSKFFTKSEPKLMRDSKNVLRNKITEENVDIGSKHYFNLKENNKCFTTNMASGECTNYIRNCLINQNINECKEFLKKPTYWTIMSKEIETLDPIIALETMKAFDFKMVKDENKKIIPETVASWSANLETKLSGDNAKNNARTIRQNSKIIEYLNSIRHVVMNEPALLNLTRNMVVNPKIESFPIPAKRFTNKYQFRNLTEFSKRIQEIWSRKAMEWKIGSDFSSQLGGSNNMINIIRQRTENDIPYLWQDLSNLIQSTETRLKILDTPLIQNDVLAINNSLNKLKDTEKKLYKTYLYRTKYADLLESGLKDPNNLVTMDNIIKFVNAEERYFVKTSQRQNKTLRMIEMLFEKIEKTL